MTDAPFPLPDLDPVLDAVRRDAAAGRLADWGSSTLIDEFTGVPSVGAELFGALHAAAGLDAAFPVGNAGLLHVYGYWFSTVPTPFGYKRDRWLDGALARAYGLPGEAFHLGALDSAAPTPLERVAAAALPVLRRPPAGSRVAEAVLDGRLSRVVLHGVPGAAVPALVYGIEPEGADPGSGELSLLTTFPFSGDPASLLEEFAREPVFRWNAVSHS